MRFGGEQLVLGSQLTADHLVMLLPDIVIFMLILHLKFAYHTWFTRSILHIPL